MTDVHFTDFLVTQNLGIDIKIIFAWLQNYWISFILANTLIYTNESNYEKMLNTYN